MSKIICNICGREEDPERWIPKTAQKIRNLGICFECLHWRTQTTLAHKNPTPFRRGSMSRLASHLDG